MNTFKFGFIGCGNMGGALAAAAAKSLSAGELAVCDSDATKVVAFCGQTGAVASTAAGIAAKSAFVCLAVKPQGLSALFAEIGDVLRARKDRFVLVSMAAGVSMERLRALAEKEDCPVIRIMPNTPVRAGEGMVVYDATENVAESEINRFLAGLSAAGRFDRIPERLIDAAGALSGCGPAFVYLFAEALADGGVECGLPREKALLYASQTLVGAAKLLLESGENPAALKDAVCSPGGTTIAGVHALECGAFRGTVMNAVKAAFEKTSKLS